MLLVVDVCGLGRMVDIWAGAATEGIWAECVNGGVWLGGITEGIWTKLAAWTGTEGI